MTYLRRFYRWVVPKFYRSWLRERLADVPIWIWKLQWWGKRGFTTISAPKKKGVLLVGFLKGGFGIGNSLSLPAFALKEAGIPFKVFDFSPSSYTNNNDNRVDSWLTTLPEYTINIFCISVLQLPILKKTLGKKFFQDRHNILYGAWELNRLPEKWTTYLEDINEIWAMSSFVGQMFRRSSSLPVYDLQLPVLPVSVESFSRKKFQIPEKDFVFLFMFDFDSNLARKNPEAVIDAFNLVFPKSSQLSVSLVIKSIHGEGHEKDAKRLEKKMSGDSRMLQINNVLSHSENASLMQCCDCYVSLHRSEGFGFTLAEAMLMGKSIITTAFSGNMDFTTPKTALLVDFQLVPVQMSFPYQNSKGEMWAEPNIEQAGKYMLNLVQDSNYGRNLVKNGQELIRNSFSTKSMGDRYKKRLSNLLK
jgi:glycosyltransferase involved in cell wall biosynthesis